MTGILTIRKPPTYSMVAATPCTENLKYGPTPRMSSYTPSRKTRDAGSEDGQHRPQGKGECIRGLVRCPNRGHAHAQAEG